LECDLEYSVPREMVHCLGHVTWGNNYMLVVSLIKPFEFLCFCSVVELSSLECDSLSLVNQFQTFRDIYLVSNHQNQLAGDAVTH
jgi:hypothetical protein